MPGRTGVDAPEVDDVSPPSMEGRANARPDEEVQPVTNLPSLLQWRAGL